ncbi:Ger(x)C family spore germination protein [Paenibacillus sp. FSL K6-2859]|uniref:Ger(x)C family spore germination protein n=1 Tax=Paenibacillus sp. FSL K6-2859 TaxID=2921482 RepID=UPI0030F91A02
MIRSVAGLYILMISLSLLLTGCWDIREVQDINYISAIGVDYKDGEYIIYAQMLDFSSVAKQEGGGASQEIPVWVGKGRGKNLADALLDIYKTNQQYLSWGQVTALVLTESVLEPERMEQVFDITNRSEEIRYTKWVYGTHGELKDLFTTTPFFKLSPLHSLLHEPMESYKQLSFIRPTQFNDFIIHYREKAATAVLPTLSITSANWSEDMRQHPILEIDGAFLIKNKESKGWKKRKELLGIRWLADRNTQAPVIVGPHDDPVGSVMLQQPRFTVELIPTKDGMKYGIKIKAHGMVQSIYKKVEVAELQKLTEDSLRDELLSTFRSAVAIGADPYQLSLILFQRNNKIWKQFQDNGTTLTENSLDKENIDVNIDLRFWGQRKDNVR